MRVKGVFGVSRGFRVFKSFLGAFKSLLGFLMVFRGLRVLRVSNLKVLGHSAPHRRCRPPRPEML